MRTAAAAAVTMLAALAAPAAAGETATVRGPDETVLAISADRLARGAGGDIFAGGQVRAVHGEVDVRCVGTLTVYVEDDLFAALEARGVVRVATGGKHLRGAHLLYEAAPRLLTMSGSPLLEDGSTIYAASDRILLYAETGVTRCEPRAELFIRKDKAREAKGGRKKFLGIF
ncbi:MAG: hypothetical protein PHN82_12425 [bacterium]|nr:hypothetical protein [bacterium]